MVTMTVLKINIETGAEIIDGTVVELMEILGVLSSLWARCMVGKTQTTRNRTRNYSNRLVLTISFLKPSSPLLKLFKKESSQNLQNVMKKWPNKNPSTKGTILQKILEIVSLTTQ